MVETLKVGLGDRSYPLHIGAGVLDRLTADWSERLTPKRLSVVADARVWEAHGEAMAARLATIPKVVVNNASKEPTQSRKLSKMISTIATTAQGVSRAMSC